MPHLRTLTLTTEHTRSAAKTYLLLIIDAKTGAAIGRKIAMKNKTAVRKKVALVMTNASANKKNEAKAMKRPSLKLKLNRRATSRLRRSKI